MMTQVFQRFKQDISGVMWLGCAAIIGLALYSFHPNDPSFNSTGHSLVVRNFCGYFGSFLADLLYQSMGMASWVIVGAGLRMSYLAFRGHEVSLRNWRLVWGGMLVLTASSLLALYFPKTVYFENQIQIGGLLGTVLANGLISVFNPAGVSVILWSLALILLIFYTEKSLRDFAMMPIQFVRFLWARVPGQTRSFGERLKVAITKLVALPTLFRRSEPVNPAAQTLAQVGPNKIYSNAPATDEDVKGIETPILEKPIKLISRLRKKSEEPSEEMPQGFFPLMKSDPVIKKRKVKLGAKVQRKIENWELPKIDLMEDPPENRMRVTDEEIEMKAELLVDKLSQFSVGGEIVGVNTGPAVTLFEFKPNADVKISKINELADDLSLALSAESVRIIAPIPGRNVVGIETSNSHRETVYLKDVIAEKDFWDDDFKLPIPLGRQADGHPKIVDLRKMPHLLVAGTTGSGKSVFVVSTMVGLLFRHSPKTLKLILVDPKQVDLAAFSKVPHLLMPPIRDPKKAVSALRYAINEMEKRYRSMSKFGARGIEQFNEIVAGLEEEVIEGHKETNEMLEEDGQRNEMYHYTPQPYIVIVVEEFGDLMAVDKGNVEQAVVRLAQMARACGIHLILAMQSPRKDVVTGLIKTNIPGRISFKVASKMDSRIILDDSGAERLLARGDMLFLAPGVAKPERHHGPWLSDPEIDSIVQCWADQGEPEYDELAMRALDGSGGGFDLDGGGNEDEEEYDERYDEVLAWVAGQKAVSASLLQRKFRLGYPRAARMIEIFESEGVVGPPNGSKPREVLVNSLS